MPAVLINVSGTIGDKFFKNIEGRWEVSCEQLFFIWLHLKLEDAGQRKCGVIAILPLSEHNPKAYLLLLLAIAMRVE